MNVEDLLHPMLNSYLRSPQWVKASVGRAYSAVPVGWRRGRHYTHFLREAQISDTAQLQQLARRKLAHTLHHALQAVPAYRSRRTLAAELDDPATAISVLRCLPPIDKEDVRRNPDGFLAHDVDPALQMKMFTGGSTSVPMTFYLHKGVTRPKEYAFMEQFHQRAGMTERDDVLALRGNALPGGRGARLWVYEPIKRQLMLSTEHLSPQHMPEYVRAMREWKPRFIQAYPSAIWPLALWLKEHPDEEVTQRIEAVMLFSETVTEQHTALLRSVFRCPVLRHYGHSERVLMAATMPDDDRYFFWPQYGFFELLDADGNVIERPGELGEIVGTAFDNEVMPLLRYRTGDMAVLSAKPHPLLPGYPAVERIEGRIQEFVVSADERLLSLNAITTAEQHPLLEFAQAVQFEQRTPGWLSMRVVMPWRLSDDERRAIGASIEERIGGGCEVDIEQVAEIKRTARGKAVMLIQHLDTRRYFGGGCA